MFWLQFVEGEGGRWEGTGKIPDSYGVGWQPAMRKSCLVSCPSIPTTLIFWSSRHIFIFYLEAMESFWTLISQQPLWFYCWAPIPKAGILMRPVSICPTGPLTRVLPAALNPTPPPRSQPFPAAASCPPIRPACSVFSNFFCCACTRSQSDSNLLFVLAFAIWNPDTRNDKRTEWPLPLFDYNFHEIRIILSFVSLKIVCQIFP